MNINESGWKTQVNQRFSDTGKAVHWSVIYDGVTSHVEDQFFRQRRDFVLEYVLETLPASAQILDLGCGAGPLTAPLRAAGRNVVAVDYSADMLSHARRRMLESGIEPAPLLQADSEFLPFRDHQFDLVLCIGVISYLPDYTKALSELRRVLRPGARAVVTTRNLRNPINSDPLRALKRLWSGSRRAPADFYPGRLLDPAVVETDLRGAGFSIDSFAGIGYGPLRVRGREVTGRRASLSLNRWVTRLADRGSPAWLYRNFSDINLWFCRKSEESRGAVAA